MMLPYSPWLNISPRQGNGDKVTPAPFFQVRDWGDSIVSGIFAMTWGMSDFGALVDMEGFWGLIVA